MLPLQRSAGNHAVGAMIAARGTLARQPGAPPTAAPADDKKKAGGGSAHVTFAGGGKAGKFDAESVQFGVRSPGALGGAKAKPKEKEKEKEKEKVAEDIHVTKLQDEHSSTLQRIAAEGRPPLTVEIRIGRMTIRIKDAFISNYQVGGGGPGAPLETLTFNGFIEFEVEAESEAGGAPTS